jgi:vacuolar-type H+-ATPase subunit E/Vma4
MTAADPALAAALEPVRRALVAAAHADAGRTLAAADAAAADTLVRARAAADRIRAEARAQGAASGRAAAAAERNRARREARAAVLRAEREIYEHLGAAARTAVAHLADEPGYPTLRRRLVAGLHRTLGPRARVDSAGGGGVIGTVPGRRLDYSLAGFADRAARVVAGRLRDGSGQGPS